MKFVPRQPEDGINVSKTHPLVEAGTLVVGLGLIFLSIFVILVFLVEFVLMFVPPDREAQLFANFLPEDLAVVTTDNERLASSQRLLDRMIRHVDMPHYSFRLELDDSDEMNAMAFPGGLIILTTGLLDAVESENELAFVLGHELGHYDNRDHVRRLGRSALFGIVMTAIIGGESGGGYGVTVAQIAELSFSREQERRADELGLRLVHEEFGHIAEATRFFERIASRQTLTTAVLGYGSTHPSPGSRIADLRSFGRAMGWSDQGPAVPLLASD